MNRTRPYIWHVACHTARDWRRNVEDRIWTSLLYEAAEEEPLPPEEPRYDDARMLNDEHLAVLYGVDCLAWASGTASVHDREAVEDVWCDRFLAGAMSATVVIERTAGKRKTLRPAAVVDVTATLLEGVG
jgi:hypothetical protein